METLVLSFKNTCNEEIQRLQIKNGDKLFVKITISQVSRSTNYNGTCRPRSNFIM